MTRERKTDSALKSAWFSGLLSPSLAADSSLLDSFPDGHSADRSLSRFLRRKKLRILPQKFLESKRA